MRRHDRTLTVVVIAIVLLASGCGPITIEVGFPPTETTELVNRPTIPSAPKPTATESPTPVPPTKTSTPPPPTSIPSPTDTPLPPTLTPTELPSTNTATAPEEGRIETIYLRRGGDKEPVILQPLAYGDYAYREGETVYGDISIRIGNETYHFDHDPLPGEPTQLPDPWEVKIDWGWNTWTRVENYGFDPKLARFWAGPLNENASLAEDDWCHAIYIKLFKESELKDETAVFFRVTDSP